MFKVLNYNISYDPKDLNACNPDKVVQAIDSIGATVVCLQETNVEWEKILSERLKDQYPTQIYVHNKKFGGCVLLQKGVQYITSESLIIKQRKKYKNSWIFPSQLVTIMVDGMKISLANVHLCPPETNEGSFSLSSLSHFLFKSNDIRQQEITELLMRYEHPEIICGDFNEENDGKACSQLYSLGYKDAMDQSDSKVTWTHPLALGFHLWSTLDHCFYYPTRIKCVDCKVFSEYIGASDHFPVLSVFEKIVEN